MRALRRPQPASSARPMPSLERLAASLAVTSVVVVPAAALLLHDNACPGEGTTAVQRFVNRLERAGVFDALTDGASAAPGACAAPSTLQPPQTYMPPSGGPPATVPTVTSPSQPPLMDIATRLGVGGGPRAVSTVPEPHRTHTTRAVARHRDGAQQR